MKKNKKTKEDQALKEENLNEVSGGKTTTDKTQIIRDYLGDGNIIANENVTYEQMLNFVDRLNNSGELDYLKRK